MMSLPTQRNPGAAEFCLCREGDSYPIRKGIVLGRSPVCNLVLPSQLVSRRHTRLSITPRGVLVEDLDSVNGTFVDGRRVERVTLRGGEQLEIGGFAFTVRRSDNLPRRSRPSATTVGSLPRHRRSVPPDDDTASLDAVAELSKAADDLLASGDAATANDLLAPVLESLRDQVVVTRRLDEAIEATLCVWAIRFAAEGNDGKMATDLVRMYTLLERPVPSDVARELARSLGSCSNVGWGVIRAHRPALASVWDTIPTQAREGVELLSSCSDS